MVGLIIFCTLDLIANIRPRRPMDKASDFESEDCGFRSPSWSDFVLYLSRLRKKDKNFIAASRIRTYAGRSHLISSQTL